MKINFKEQLKQLSTCDYVMLSINFAAFLCGLVISLVNGNAIAESVFTVLIIAVLIADMLYFSRFKNILAYIAPITIVLLTLINFASIFVVGLSVFANSTSALAIIAYLLMPISANIFIVCNRLLRNRQDKIIVKHGDLIRSIFTIAMLVALLAFLIVAAITSSGTTAINTNVVNMILPLTIMTFAVLSIIIKLMSGRVIKLKRIIAVISLVLVVAIVSQFAVVEGMAINDSKKNNADFVKAFGTVEDSKLNEPRVSDYNMADFFVGMKTKNYDIRRDILYYTGTIGEEEGMTLRYDMYYPTYENAHKSVLVNIHGGGGDKDTGNYAHRNKYFASRGYVVYDIQIGDFNEKNINVQNVMRTYEKMLDKINEFFAFAVKNNGMRADFNNTFLTGVSMGGGLVSMYAYSYQNNTSATGVNIKGIIPVYPGYNTYNSGINNYLNYVTRDSAPCLLIMSLSDVIVNRDVVELSYAAFEKVGNEKFSCVGISYSGHGSDGYLAGRFNQSYVYYTERFMMLMAQ